MLLPFLFLQLVVLTIANPFHKYPYVFLLDIGNEEIEKTQAEQIRLTVPGGSMAIKYPATGDGNLIGHVRVSGIDFGSDLKANIVEGGPGYKYVVIIFAGNPGNSYDAVVTIQTVNSEENDNSSTNSDNNDNGDDGVDGDDGDDGDDDGKELDNNINSIEDTNDSGSKIVYSSEDSEVMQSSSKIYKYAVKDAIDSQKYGDDESSNNDDGNEQSNDYSDNNKRDNSYAKDDFSDRDVSVREKVSGKYTAFKPHFYGGVRFYPQAAVYTQSIYAQGDDDTDASVKDDDANQSNKYRDSNNHPEIDYASPVEY